MTEDAKKTSASGKSLSGTEPSSLDEQRRKQYFEEIERCMLSLRPLAGVTGKVTATPLFAFVALLSQDVQGRLNSLKQTRDEVRAAMAAEKGGLLGMLEEERRNKNVTGMNVSPQALTSSVATVSLISMLKQLDIAISNEMQSLASWLVQIEGMGILAMVESSCGDGSEIPALAAQVEAQSISSVPTTMSRLESIVGPLNHSSPIVQHAAGTLISTCVSLANASKGRAASSLPANDALLLAAQTLAGKAGNGCPSPTPNGQLPVNQQHYTMEELQLLLSCMHPSAPTASAV